MVEIFKQKRFPVFFWCAFCLKFALDSLLPMASSASGHDALQDYIENHSYLMRPKKPLPQPKKSDPLLESFERWNQSMKQQMAMEKQLREITDLDRLLHEALKAQKETAADPVKQIVEANSHQPPVMTSTDEPVGMEPQQCQVTMDPVESGIAPGNAPSIAERCNVAECARPVSEAQPVQSGAAKTVAAPESKGVGYVESHWSKEEWRTWLRNSGFASRRAYERQVRHKFRKPSAKWRNN